MSFSLGRSSSEDLEEEKKNKGGNLLLGQSKSLSEKEQWKKDYEEALKELEELK